VNVSKGGMIAALVATFVGATAASGDMLPNGWRVTPAGSITQLGTLPLRVVLDRTGRYAAVSNSGYGKQSITVVEASSGRVVAAQPMDATFYGLAFGSDDKTLYASDVKNDGVRRFAFDDATGALRDLGVWKAPDAHAWIAGVAVSPDGGRIYAAGNTANRVYAIDSSNGSIAWSAAAGSGPYAIAVSRDGARIFVSDWSGASVSVLSAADGRLLASVPVDPHPNAVLGSADGSSVFVACANGGTVDEIDASTLRVQRAIDVSLFANAPEGTTPDGLALSAAGNRLYVADADEDAVSVIDLHAPGAPVIGAIPVGWYATDVALAADGRSLFVLDGKGLGAHPNPQFGSGHPLDYVANLATGDLERADIGNASALADGLRAARADSPYGSSAGGGTLQNTFGVEHVIYIIKENRTYDQILGDDPRGNGDAALAMYGQRITPNIHRLADDFALLDDFDVDSEVSADGHNWTDAAYATDYVQKLWPSNYSGRGRDYDFEGTNAVKPTAGYLWDHIQSVRDYGEQMQLGAVPSIPMDPALATRTDPDYTGWNLRVSDQTRMDEWLREFHDFERDGRLPKLEVVYLPDDHTAATRAGYRTPDAMVASNDYAVARLVDAVSHSRYWTNTVIFAVEDDAQDGPDHVSDQRSIAIVAGGAVRRGVVDHTHYTQCSVIRTIELLLGMQPMSQFDAAATPMMGLFTATPDAHPWTASKPNVDIDAVNGKQAVDAQTSARFNLAEPDASDAAAFDRVLMDDARSGADAALTRHRSSRGAGSRER
jgi:DNA-binding beta-propeller fold protein YncE